MASRLISSARSALTLAVLGVLLLVGVAWGWNAATQPFPERAETPVCIETSVEAGTKVYPDQVTVSVLNAGAREGLAGRTMRLFLDDGFGEGTSGNAPGDTQVATAEVWTDDPGNPAVKLVAGRFGDVEVVRRDTTAPGVTVVVGDDFTDLVKGRRNVKAREDTAICSPPVA